MLAIFQRYQIPLPALFIGVQLFFALLNGLLYSIFGDSKFKEKRFLPFVQGAICLATLAVMWNETIGGRPYIVYATSSGVSKEIGINLCLCPSELILIFCATISFVAAIIQTIVRKEEAVNKSLSIFGSIYLCGVIGIVMSRDLFNMYVFMEIMAITLITLFATEEKSRQARAEKSHPLPAAFTYFTTSIASACIFLLGIAMVYVATGDLYLVSIEQKARHSDHKAILQITSGIVTILIGMTVKTGFFPSTKIIIAAYKNAENSVTAALIPSATKVWTLIVPIILAVIPDFQTKLMIQHAFAFFGTISAIIIAIRAKEETNFRTLLIISCIINSVMCFWLNMLSMPKSSQAANLIILSDTICKVPFFLLEKNEKSHQKKSNSSLYNSVVLIAAYMFVGLPGTIAFKAKMAAIESGLKSNYFEIPALISIFVIISTIFTVKSFMSLQDNVHTIKSSKYLFFLFAISIVFSLSLGMQRTNVDLIALSTAP